MESNQGIWMKTRDEGVLLFKNVSLAVKESDKEDKKSKEYEHTEENWIIDLNKNELQYPHGAKYFHKDMGVFCTVVDNTFDDDGKLTSIKVRIDEPESTAIMQNTAEDLTPLQTHIDMYIRGLQKSGSKFTIKGKYDCSHSFKDNLQAIFGAAGYKSNGYRLFCGDKLLDKDTDISSIYQYGEDLYILAFESQGKAKKFARFSQMSEYGTWSCGGSPDSITFIPKEDVEVTGFVAYAAKEHSEYQLKYKIKVTVPMLLGFSKINRFKTLVNWC